MFHSLSLMIEDYVVRMKQYSQERKYSFQQSLEHLYIVEFFHEDLDSLVVNLT